MATEVLRLGIDPRPAEAGAARFTRATQGASASAGTLTAAVGVLGGAMVAFGAARQVGAAVRGMVEFDQAMTQSLAIMGDVSDTMRGEMADAAKEVGRELNFAATEGAEAFFFLASAGLDAEQSIAALPAVAEFARAGMFDFATATDLATDAQSALGLTVDDAARNLENMTRVTDVLVKANTLANASVEQFASALTSEAGAAMKSFNIDVEEGVAVLAAFADQGVKGQTAGAGFSRILRLMTSAAVNNREEMEALGLELFDAEGNLRNMADVVEQLEGALGGMSDAQRVAALESIGFQARVQGVLLPLLGTSQAIREYETGLRQAAGTTAEVSSNQMQSLENRIGMIREEFSQWRMEMVERTVPAMEWAIENVNLLTDAVVGLSVALGGIMALKVAAWAAGAATAFIGWGTAVASLAVGVRTLHGAVTLLKVAIGPAGWLLIGVTAVTGGVMAWRSRQRELNDELLTAEQRLSSYRTALAGWTEEARQAEAVRLENAIRRQSDALAEMETEMERLGDLTIDRSADPSDRAEAIQAERELKTELEAQRQLVARLEDDYEAVTAAIREGVGGAEEMADATNNAAQAAEGLLDTLGQMAGVLSDALDLDIEREGLLRESLELMGELRSIAEDQTRSLEDRNQAAREFNRLQDAAVQSMQRLTEASLGVGDVTAHFQEGFRELPAAATGVQESMYDIGEAGAESARFFESEWVTAIQIVGSSLGGLASQVANVVGAFAMGGPKAGAAAAGGLVLGELFGGENARREFERAAEQWERALDDFADMFAETDRFDRMRERVEAEAGAMLEQALMAAIADMPRFTGGMAAEFVPQVMETFETEGIDAALASAAELMEMFGLGTDEIDALKESMRELFEDIERRREEARQASIAAMQDDLAVRRLVAAGMEDEAEAMRMQIRHTQELAEARELEDAALLETVQAVHEMEQAALAAAQAERELAAERRETELVMSLAAREAALWGTSMEASIAQAEAAAEAERSRARAMEEAGDISEETLKQWLAVIDGELTASIRDAEQAMMDAARAAREAAEAERQRQMALHQRLELEFLRLTGQDAAATALENQIEMERLLEQGADQATLALLSQVQALRAQEEAASGAGRAATDTARAMDQMGRALNAPASFRTSLNRHLAQAVEPGFSGDLFGAVGASSPSFDGAQQTTNNVDNSVSVREIHVHPPAGADGDEILDQIIRASRRRQRRGGTNDFLMVGS